MTNYPRLARSGSRYLVLAILLGLLFLGDLALGSVRLPLAELITAVFEPAADSPAASILKIFRLPKAITALSAGAALAVAGLLLQTLFRNPLAGPDSLGIGAGASLGVGAMILLGGNRSASLLGNLGLGGYAALALAAALGAGLVLVLILALSRRVESGVTLLIVGILVGYLAGSLVSLLVFFGSPQKMQIYLGWTYGSFGGVTNDRLPILLGAILLGLALTFRSSKALDAFLLGERYAESLGIRVRGARIRVLLAASILAGAVTAFCGPIAFLGIAAPQAARRFFKASAHAILIPASALFGALFALAADIAASAPGGGAVIPVNPLLALIGAPIILTIFLRGSRESAREELGT